MWTNRRHAKKKPREDFAANRNQQGFIRRLFSRNRETNNDKPPEVATGILDELNPTQRKDLDLLLQEYARQHEARLSELFQAKSESQSRTDLTPAPDDNSNFTPLEQAEMQVIKQYLEKNDWNQARASKELCIRPNTMIAKMRKYGIMPPTGKAKRGRRAGAKKEKMQSGADEEAETRSSDGREGKLTSRPKTI